MIADDSHSAATTIIVNDSSNNLVLHSPTMPAKLKAATYSNAKTNTIVHKENADGANNVVVISQSKQTSIETALPSQKPHAPNDCEEKSSSMAKQHSKYSQQQEENNSDAKKVVVKSKENIVDGSGNGASGNGEDAITIEQFSHDTEFTGETLNRYVRKVHN